MPPIPPLQMFDLYQLSTHTPMLPTPPMHAPMLPTKNHKTSCIFDKALVLSIIAKNGCFDILF